MLINLCKNRHRGADVYIVGTGPSMRVFPSDYLQNKIVIGLNQAWRHCAPTYCITVHPELYAEYQDVRLRSACKPVATTWFVKHKPPLNLPYNDPTCYVFDTSPQLSIVNPVSEKLFIGRGVQQTAMHLAAFMGAKNIILVGVDMCDLGGDHHAHDQHVRFHGLPPTNVYKEYRDFTAAVRYQIEQKFGARVLTLSPLLGADHGSEDYLRLCEQRGLSKLPPPADTSGYGREKTDVRPPE